MNINNAFELKLSVLRIERTPVFIKVLVTINEDNGIESINDARNIT